MVNTKNVVPPLASIFFLFLGSAPNCARVEKFLDYKTGKELDARTAIKTPLVINPNGRVVINANAIKATTIEMFRPFVYKQSPDQINMIITICVRKGKTLYVCYVGRGFRVYNTLWDHYPSNETAKKCNDSKNKLPGFDSQLHGFKVTVKNNEIETTQSFSKKVMTYPIDEEAKCVDIYKYSAFGFHMYSDIFDKKGVITNLII
uniref:Astacin domain-containing protein n=1 Tax=Globodera pallida TaxID=36090 RepID=A0A183BIF0_GLOPA